MNDLKPGTAQENEQHSFYRWIQILLVIVLLIMSWLFILILPQWLSVNIYQKELPINLHSIAEADYSIDQENGWLPGINLTILESVLHDLEPDAQDIVFRVATVVAQIHTPIPTAYSGGDFPATATPSAPPLKTVLATSTQSGNISTPTQNITITQMPLLTGTTGALLSTSTATLSNLIFPTSTATYKPTRTATQNPTANHTQTQTTTPTQTLLSTPTHTRSPDATPIPTPTQQPAATVFHTDTPQPGMTFTPQPSSTNSPTSTTTFTSQPSATPTHTSTFLPSFTPTGTLLRPTSTGTLTPTPELITTLIFTPTTIPMVTNTPTPDDACAPPDPRTGYVLSITPTDGSSDESISTQPIILFNQPMDITSLTYGDERHIYLSICETPECNQRISIPATILIETNIFLYDTVTIIPSSLLLPNRTYRLVVGNQIRNHPDCGALNQAVRVTSDFTTAP